MLLMGLKVLFTDFFKTIVKIYGLQQVGLRLAIYKNIFLKSTASI